MNAILFLKIKIFKLILILFNPLFMKKIITILFVLFANVTFLFAQESQIKGSIADLLDSTSLKGATISISSTDSAVLQTVVTSTNGSFEFGNLKKQVYLLKISNVGYKPSTINIDLEKDNGTLGKIYLNRMVKEMETVTIVSTVAAVVQKDDTSQYNAKQYKVNPDATTEDMIKKMPGITVDKNGTITAQGEQVKKVTVDGKDFFGDDASAALKNIPAAAVDKIQVFDRMSDQAQMTGIDDGNSQKAINIITKAGINNAQFGRVYVGAGTEQTYAAGGNTSFFKGDRRISLVGNFNNINQQNFGSQDLLGVTGNASNNRNSPPGSGNFRGPGAPVESFTNDQSSGISTTNAIGINYSDKWSNNASITGSYFFNNSKNELISTTNNNIFQENQFTLKNTNNISNNNNHRINARLELKLDSSNMLFIIPSLNFQNNISSSSNDIKSYKNENDSLNNSNSGSLKLKDGYNLKNTIMYRHSFKKKNRIFSTSLNTTFTKNDGASKINGNYRFYDILGLPIFPDSIQQQSTDNLSDGNTIGGSITYNEPLGKKGRGQLQLEYNPSVQTNKANQQTFAYDGDKYSIFDSLLSNKFTNTITTHNGGVTYRFTRSKDEQMSINVNYQQATLASNRTLPSKSSVNQSFKNFLPYAYWRKKISASTNIRMFYRASTNFPSINQLQDVVNLSNPLSVSSGNKNLVQSYTQYMGGRYSYSNTKTNRNLFAGVFMQTAADYISNATFIATNDSTLQEGVVLRKGSQLSKPINLDGYRFIRTYISTGIPIKKLKTTVNLNTYLIYSKMPGQINNVFTTTNTYQYNAGVSLVSNVSEYIDYNVSYSANIYRAKTIGTFVTNNNYVNHVVAVVFNLLSKKGWFLQNDLNSQTFKGLSGGLDRTFTLWNASVGKKFFKDKTGELKISVFDILKQNQSLSRNVTNTFLEDSRNNVLGQYFTLAFAYNLKNFGTPKKQEAKDDFIPKVGYPGQ